MSETESLGRGDSTNPIVGNGLQAEVKAKRAGPATALASITGKKWVREHQMLRVLPSYSTMDANYPELN